MGKAAIIQQIRKDPLARILRVGKLTLAALEATLGLFFDEATALREVPTLAMLARDAADIAAQADRIAAAVRQAVPAAHVETLDGSSQMGSGSLPTQNIATRLVAVASDEVSADDLAARLRQQRAAGHRPHPGRPRAGRSAHAPARRRASPWSPPSSPRCTSR